MSWDSSIPEECAFLLFFEKVSTWKVISPLIISAIASQQHYLGTKSALKL
jgi:hypothetical protein